MPRVIDISKYRATDKPIAKVQDVAPQKVQPVVIQQPATNNHQPLTKAQLLAQLDEQVLEVRRDRNKVSNRARIRWQSGADATELASLYETINAFTEDLKKLWDKRQHVEKFGTLPSEQPTISKQQPTESADVALLKLEKKKLEEKKSKLRAKLKPNAKEPYNSARKLLWQQELERIEAEWQVISDKIKRMYYDARGTAQG